MDQNIAQTKQSIGQFQHHHDLAAESVDQKTSCGNEGKWKANGILPHMLRTFYISTNQKP